MKRLLPIVFLLGSTGFALAQSWSFGSEGIALPPSVAGTKVSGATMTCRGDDYFLKLADVVIGSGGSGDVPVALLVDAKVFATSADQGTGLIAVPPAALGALKSGKRLTLSIPVAGVTIETTFALKGSSKALEALAGACAPAGGPEKVAGNGASMEVMDEYVAGSAIAVPFAAPAGDNRFWIGFAPVGSGPIDYLGNGYAYTSSGNPAVLTAPGKPGDYELRFADDTAKVKLLAKQVTITPAGAATLTAPSEAVGGQTISVTHSGPDGRANTVAILPAGAPDNRNNSYHGAATSSSPATLRVPATGGAYEVRYLLAVGEAVVAARQPLTVSQAPGVTLTAAQAKAGEQFAVALGTDAPRLSGDYIYIARPGTPGSNYDGGYASVPSSGDAKIAAPKDVGDWEIRYVIPDNGSWSSVGSAKLTVN
jgi:hypothetical protein